MLQLLRGVEVMVTRFGVWMYGVGISGVNDGPWYLLPLALDRLSFLLLFYLSGNVKCLSEPD